MVCVLFVNSYRMYNCKASYSNINSTFYVCNFIYVENIPLRHVGEVPTQTLGLFDCFYPTDGNWAEFESGYGEDKMFVVVTKPTPQCNKAFAEVIADMVEGLVDGQGEVLFFGEISSGMRILMEV